MMSSDANKTIAASHHDQSACDQKVSQATGGSVHISGGGVSSAVSSIGHSIGSMYFCYRLFQLHVLLQIHINFHSTKMCFNSATTIFKKKSIYVIFVKSNLSYERIMMGFFKFQLGNINNDNHIINWYLKQVFLVRSEVSIPFTSHRSRSSPLVGFFHYSNSMFFLFNS